ncbi:14-3-3 protein like protein [Aduncisulcus paluster]|uniref:14-3-3 protein like protein n=1 Tax=Aduncisulcus paluster TaxID=2918883 RepID=A0ABQ5KUK0_9EUKA|nr:14-3-3 protein like protein [Aduncisulcus paluster]|eukprot:gnl/Carplike_NY0171/3922_a5295_250.p1 GENE.gnl/Carplike_NY0171/3922_a5295_250~~gnl/Carplike_NY0171/3922_a5295_250.p1  ORF type:complete len:259 (+),score=38.99 gnl/Carplike_NY0171/3922_a5295_250:235-1011(+)
MDIGHGVDDHITKEDQIRFNISLLLKVASEEHYISYYKQIIPELKYLVELTKQDLPSREKLILQEVISDFIGYLRRIWRHFGGIASHLQHEGQNHKSAIVFNHNKIIEQEIKSSIDELLVLIEMLIKYAKNDLSRCFYLKLKGDLFRYTAEYSLSHTKKIAVESSLSSYQAAASYASSAHLPASHEMVLRIALNMSILFYEVIGSPDRACHISKQAFDNANASLSQVRKKDLPPIAKLLGIFRTNLTMWSVDLVDEED